jgi:hypothetical protein
MLLCAYKSGGCKGQIRRRTALAQSAAVARNVRALSAQRWAADRESCRRSGSLVLADVTRLPPNRGSRPIAAPRSSQRCRGLQPHGHDTEGDAPGPNDPMRTTLVSRAPATPAGARKRAGAYRDRAGGGGARARGRKAPLRDDARRQARGTWLSSSSSASPPSAPTATARRIRHPAGAGGGDHAALRRANPPGAGARGRMGRVSRSPRVVVSGFEFFRGQRWLAAAAVSGCARSR